MKKKSLLISYFFVSGLFLMTCLLLGRNFKVSATSTPPITDQLSILDQIYTRLVASGFGTESSGDHGDFGVKWNRIASSAYWIPDGDAGSSDVVSGKTFYGNSRTKGTGTWSFLGNATVNDVLIGKTFYGNTSELLTGTAPAPIDFANMQYSTMDDYAGPDGAGGTEDYQGEEAVWTTPATDVWKDTRTGVYWTSDQGTKSNNFTEMSLNTCDFFNTSPRKDYAGGDGDCGVAINYCATLDFGGRTDWYLPSQKELMQAYIDGMYNKAGSTLANAAAFTTTNSFWSSSEASDDPTLAWRVFLYNGTSGLGSKATGRAVRCVSRD